MRRPRRVQGGVVRDLVGTVLFLIGASLAGAAPVAAASASVAELQAAGAVPLHAVTVADGTGLLMGTADRGPGTELSWWFPVENPDELILQGHVRSLTGDAREWGVAVDEDRGVALVYWRHASDELGWVEIEADGMPGASGSLVFEGSRGRHLVRGVRAVSLADGWPIASPAGRAHRRGPEVFSLSRLEASPAESLTVEGRLVDLVGRGGNAWSLRWDEASGALELGRIAPPTEPTQPAVIESWTRLDTLGEFGPWGVIINPIDEPILGQEVPNSVITPIDRPIDWDGSPRLALLPAGGAWEGVAAWRGCDDETMVAFFDAEGGTLVQSLPDGSDRAGLHWRVVVGSDWCAAQGGLETSGAPVRIGDLTEDGLDAGYEVARGHLLAAWETSSAVAVLTGGQRDDGGRDLAIPSKPIIPIGVGSRDRGGRDLAIPSKPILPIGIGSRDDGGRALAIPSKPVIPIGLRASPGKLILLGLPGTPGEPIDFERLASIDLAQLTAADGVGSHLLDVRPDGDGAWLLRSVHEDGRLQAAWLPELVAPVIDGWHDLHELAGSRAFPIKPPNEPPRTASDSRPTRPPIDVLLRWIVLAESMQGSGGRP